MNEDKFINYVEKEAYIKPADIKPPSQNVPSTQFFDDLGSIFTEAVAKSGTPNVQIKFINQTMANIKLNSGFL